MSIAVVLSVTGQAWARDAEGNLRELRPGDVLQEGEVVITSDDGSVDLDFGGGEAGLVVIEPGQEVLMQAELVPGAEVDAEQASVQDDEVEALLAALEDDDIDLLDILEDTAAGAGAGGDGAGGGHGFIRLARITEGVDPLNYQYGVGLAGGPEGGLGEPQLLEEESLPTISVVDAEGGNQVDEAALDDGSNPGSPAESISGGFNITHSGDDTTASLVVGGVDVTNGGVVNGTYGTLTVTLNGGVYEWTYTLDDNTTDHPDNTSTGTSEGIQDVFSVTVTDSDGDTASTTLTIDVLDDGPIAVDDSVADEVPEDGSVDIDVFANDTAGADGVDLTTGIAVASGPSKGSVVYNGDGTFTYTADPGEEGVDSFTYTLTDSDGDTSTATVDLTIAPDSVPSISVVDAEGGNQVDEAALDDGSNPGSPAESVSGSFNITHSGDDTTASLVVGGVDVTNGGVVNGTYGTLTVTLNAGVYEWTYALDDNTTDHPDDTSTGTSEGIQDVFSVTVTDSDGDTDDTSLTIDVLDDGPIAVDDSVAGEVPEDGSVDIDVFANDTAGADGVDLTTGIAVASGPSKGSVIYNGDGTFTYTANPGEEGADSFTYTLTDGDGDTATATVNLTIAPDSVPSISVVDAEGGNQVDEAALDDGSNPGSPAESVSGSFNITHSGTDTTASLVVGGVDVTNGGVVNGTYGTLTVMLNAGVYEWTYTLDDNTTDHPDDTSTGTSEGIQDVFAVTVTDSDGDTDDTSLTIDVLDDGPVAVDESPSVLTEGDAAISGNLLTNDSEGADGATVTHVDVGSGFVTLGSGTDLGGGDFGFSVTGVGDYVFNADGSWSFTPADSVDNSSGDVDASFSYRITDGDGDTDEASKAISIMDGDDPQDANGIMLTVDEDDLADGSDTTKEALSDSDTLSFTLGSDALVSMAFSTDLSGLTTNTDGVAGDEVVWVRNSDSEVVGQIGGVTAITLSLSNVDLAAGTVQVTATLADNFQHLSGNGENTLDLGSVNVVATDSDGDTAVGAVNPKVVDDVPDAVDESPSVLTEGDAAISGNLLTNDTEGADGATVTHVDLGSGFVALSSGTDFGGGDFGFSVAGVGDYVFNADGSWSFTPADSVDNSSGDVDASFSYRITDGDGDTDEASKAISITDGDDPQDANGIMLTVDEDDLADGSDTTKESLSDSDTLSFTLGSDALVSMVFSTDLSGLTTNTDGVAGDEVVWVRNSDSEVVGQIGGVTAITLSLSNVDLAAGTVQVTATLADNFQHLSGNGENTLDLGSVNVVVTDSDGDTAVGAVNPKVVDDVPDAVDESPSVLTEGDAAISGNLLTNDTEGADGATVTHVDLGSGFVALSSGTDFGGGDFGFSVAGVGDYVFNADGSWSFTPADSVDNSSGDVDASFSYRITDGDGDTDEASKAISITDGDDPQDANGIMLTVDEDDLADGSDTTKEALSDSDTLSFTLGSDALVSMAFSTDLSGLTTNTDGVAGDEVVWVRNSDSEIVGQIGGVTAITLSLSSVDLAAGTVQVTATLADNFQHLSGNDENTLDLGSVNVVATDSDGDTAVGAVNPKVVDDVPIDFMPTSGILNNNSGSSVTESLNTLSALGADNYGGSSTNVTFDAAQEGDSGFTSNGLVINYYVSADGKTLTASTSDTEGGVDPGNTVFTADIDDAFDEYTLTMVGTIDNGFGVSFEDLSGTGEAGNSSFKIVESSDVDSDLEILFTPLGSAGTINSDSDDVGVDSQFIDTGDGLRVDFGRFGNDDKGTGNGNDDTFVIDGKETINGFRFGIDQIAGGSTASLRLGVFDANSPLDNDLSNDVKDIISKVEVYNDQGGLVATWNGVDGEVNGITFSSGGGEVTVSGLGADYDVVTFSADGYDSIEIYHEKILDTDGKFSLNDLKVSQSDTGDPVDLSFDTILTDTDGDTATGTIEVTAAPAEADILGTSGNDDLVGDSGDNFLFAGGGDDTLTGGAGDDILWGGPGADTFVWNLGDEGTDSDPAEDEVTDFTLGDFGSDVDADKLDFSDILSSMGDEVDPAYLQATDDGVNTTLHISTTGGMTEGDVSAADQTILLEGIVTTIADLQSNNQLDIE